MCFLPWRLEGGGGGRDRCRGRGGGRGGGWGWDGGLRVEDTCCRFGDPSVGGVMNIVSTCGIENKRGCSYDQDDLTKVLVVEQSTFAT